MNVTFSSSTLTIVFFGQAERFALVGIEVDASGEFWENAVVEDELVLMAEHVGEETRSETAIASQKL